MSRDLEHESRCVRAIARAFQEIPYYQKLGRQPPAENEPLADVLGRLPLMCKREVRSTLPKQWVPIGRDAKSELGSGAIEIVETSGSTGERVRVLWDKGWWPAQKARAMRTNPLVAKAMENDYREAVLTTPASGMSACGNRELSFFERIEDQVLLLNVRPDPTYWRPDDMDRMLDEIVRHETVGLEADPIYLAFLARHARERGRRIEVGFVQLTYAFAPRTCIRAIREAYDGPIFGLYGSSELGVLFMQGEDGRLHHAPFTTHVELLPVKAQTPGAERVALVAATTMDRHAMPLVRFVQNDLVQVGTGESRFTTVPPLDTIEGRVADALVRPDGAVVTCGAIDRALEKVPGLFLYQVNQHAPNEVDVDFVGGEEKDVRDALSPLLEGIDLSVRTATAIGAEPSGKYRVCRRHFSFQVST
jgi:phenylacetate-CoA ligase